MAHTPSHIWRRGNQWYFKANVPRALRHLFLSTAGKPMDKVAIPLGDSKSQAERDGARLLGEFKDLFARAPIMSADAVAAEVQKLRAVARIAAITETVRRDVRGEKLESAPVHPDWESSPPRFTGAIHEYLVHYWTKHHGLPPVQPGTAQFDEIMARVVDGLQKSGAAPAEGAPVSVSTATVAPGGVTISQAADAFYDHLQRDPKAAPRKSTIDGHRNRVNAFVEHCGDLPLAAITRRTASDFLDAVGKARALSNQTLNSYASTLQNVFKRAIAAGRFEGNNPFDDLDDRKAVRTVVDAFTVDELQAIFDALPREVKPATHTPATALPWIAAICAYSGMRREEAAQLTVADIKNLPANGNSLYAFDVHNGDDGHKLKNESSARTLPIHSALLNAGLLDYVAALPQDGPLFPGLTRRESKDDKLGGRVGELFGKLIKRIGINRPKGHKVTFHSFRHSATHAMEANGAAVADIHRVTGHYMESIALRVYSGPTLYRVKAAVELIKYDGLKI
jgi:integrase